MPAEDPTAGPKAILARLAELEAEQSPRGDAIRRALGQQRCSVSGFSRLRVGGRPLESVLGEAARRGSGPRFELAPLPSRRGRYMRMFKPRTVLMWVLLKGWTFDELEPPWSPEPDTGPTEEELLGERIEQLLDEAAKSRKREQDLRAKLRTERDLRRLAPRETLLAQSQPIHGRGIYFLWLGSELVYIGQSETVYGRLANHLGCKEFDRYTFLPVAAGESLTRLEALYIRALNPTLNKTKPRLIEDDGAEPAAAN